MYVIIHGPLDEDFLRKNLQRLSSEAPDAQVIISIWQHDELALRELLSSGDTALHIRIIVSNDVLNPGFYNINRQIILVRAGAGLVTEMDALVIKLRMDQTLDFRRLLRILDTEKMAWQGRLVTTNCYTRRDRLYHPSDMLQCGSGKTLRDYWLIATYPDTHLDCLLAIQTTVAQGVINGFHAYWPESRLFMQYLNHVGETLTHTQEDSELLLKKHIYLINVWDIGLKWKKFLGGRCYLIPYRFCRRPFDGGPLEYAYNYLAEDLHGYSSSWGWSAIWQVVSRLWFGAGLYAINSTSTKRLIITLLGRGAWIAAKLMPPFMRQLLHRVKWKTFYLINHFTR